MSETIQVTLSEAAKADLEALARADGVSKEELVRKAIETYLSTRRFHDLRARILEQIERDRPGGYTDEDIFRMVS
ncbi:MAG TPA: CopG family transcriptional regulator [Longimicrobium sp.]|nr:CopG family transcriptional regulator [Longimicrobium sp.]